VIMVVGQKVALGRIHARKLVSVHVSPKTITIEIGADDIRTVQRTTDQPVRNLKAQRSRKAAKVS
jgi:transposase